jgi:hypothetical protein
MLSRLRVVKQCPFQGGIVPDRSWKEVDDQVVGMEILLVQLPLMRFPVTRDLIGYYTNVLEFAQARKLE